MEKERTRRRRRGAERRLARVGVTLPVPAAGGRLEERGLVRMGATLSRPAPGGHMGQYPGLARMGATLSVPARCWLRGKWTTG